MRRRTRREAQSETGGEGVSNDDRGQQQPPESHEPSPENYEPPRVDSITTEGPAITAAGDSPKQAVVLKQ
jgi:hypothetical protein